MYEELMGKRYVGLVRCSTDGQSDTSIPDQLALLRAFADKHGMIHVDDVLRGGVSGSKPGNRSDLDDLVARKRDRNDYDILLVQDTTRLTRGGVEHGANVEFEFTKVGVRIVFIADQLPDGDFGGVVKSFLYFSGKQTAKSTSFSSTRGSMSSLEQGRSAHCRRPPYGTDKAYVAPDGSWLHVIRTMPNGTQFKLDAKTGAVIGTFGKNEATGARSHYVKQKEESVILVRGEEKQVAIVNRIFRRALIDGWGPNRIAEELNLEGVASPWNSVWNPHCIYEMLRNPVYLGVGVANRYSAGIYYMRSPNQPKAAQIDAQTLATRKNVPQKIRPKADWFERSEPHLAEFLDADLRDLARAFQQKFWERMAQGHVRKPHGDRHLNSPYILKNILRSKQGGHPMTGQNKGRVERPMRYYRITKMLRVSKKGTIYGRLVPAEPLEHAVFAALREVLATKADLRDRLNMAIREQSKAAARDHEDLDKLLNERAAVADELGFIIDELGKIGREAVKRKTAQLETKLTALDARIEQARRLSGQADADGGEMTDALVIELGRLSDMLDSAAPAALRRLMEILIGRLEVDLETLDVEMDLRLPSWAMANAQAIKSAMGLALPFAVKTERQTHREDGVILGQFSCARRPTCFECRRRAA